MKTGDGTRRWCCVTDWPWPGETREDKAKRVALSYRRILERLAAGEIDDPAGELHRQDAYWTTLGVHWSCPSWDAIDDDAWLSAADMVTHLSHLVYLTEQQIRQWAYRKRNGLGDGIDDRSTGGRRILYNVGDVLAYMTRQRNRRMCDIA